MRAPRDYVRAEDPARGFLSTRWARILDAVQCAIEAGDVEWDEEVSESALGAALKHIMARQRKGEALGVLQICVHAPQTYYT